MNAFLYAVVLIVWGTTWLAIARQAGGAPPLTSAFYRFLTAALIMGALTAGKGLWTRLKRRDLLFSFFQGACLYSLNFLCFYYGIRYISGGMESLVFSTSVLFNALAARVFWKESVPRGFAFSAPAGLAGLFLILMRDLDLQGGDSWKGVLLCLGGTALFSLGNMIGRRQHRAGLPVLLSNSYAMGWGTLLLGTLILITRGSFALPLRADYLLPLLYLAVPGSVIAFTAYLTLVNNIGPQKASFVTVMTPLIALILALLFEGESLWMVQAGGVGLILLANWNLQRRQRPLPRALPEG